jgi:subtilisin family serine protease
MESMRKYSMIAAACAASLLFASCGGGANGGSSGGNVSVIPPVAQSPTPAPSSQGQAITCPTSGPAAQSVASIGSASVLRRAAPAAVPGSPDVPNLLTVTYAYGNGVQRIDAVASRAGATPVTTARLGVQGTSVRVLHVSPASMESVAAQLRSVPGVQSVEPAQYRERMSTVSVNDPYYRGFGTGSPYYESSSSPGQWDMHIIGVGSAWGAYSRLPAVGTPIAIIDTGVDVTHPEMRGGKIVRQACYVTYPSTSTQTTGAYAVDTDGHGTNVAGIADADTNNSFGFAGVAYDAPLLAYRIFPTDPSGGCENNTSAQCSTTDVDEVSAINDAVAHGARVINLSLGAPGPLSNCKDTLEENAIESAIAHGVVVVAAAGNEGKTSLDCPAAYPGVIAVGAEGLTGSSDTSQTVASYSNSGPSSGGGSGGAYLVAPGGTASTSSDNDDLHWIENITSSEMPNASEYCTIDVAGEAGDCRADFTGTSQATPHVAGTVSLMLGLRPGLTPAEIAADLCSTAVSIGNSKQGCGRLDAAAAVAKALTQ